MSSGGGGSKQESIENYEKDYLERLEREKKSPDLQNFIFKMAEEAKVHVAKDYIGFCTFCTMGVTREEITYKNNLLFHPNCFEQQGKNFPPVNIDLAKREALTKIELVQLKNLKIRMAGTKSTPRPTPRTKAKKKKTTRRKKPTGRKTRRKPTRRKTKRRPAKRRKAIKRGKSKRVSRRKSKRRPSRRSSRRKRR